MTYNVRHRRHKKKAQPKGLLLCEKQIKATENRASWSGKSSIITLHRRIVFNILRNRTRATKGRYNWNKAA